MYFNENFFFISRVIFVFLTNYLWIGSSLTNYISSGECLSCLGNTGGWSCDVCVPGYYGNPGDGFCKPCACNIYGASSPVCDPRSGKPCNIYRAIVVLCMILDQVNPVIYIELVVLCTILDQVNPVIYILS